MVHVPKVMQQERVSHQQVEQTVEVPVPMTQDRELANCASYKRQWFVQRFAKSCTSSGGGCACAKSDAA